MSRYDLVVLGDCNPDVLVLGDDVDPAFGQQEKLVGGISLVIGTRRLRLPSEVTVVTAFQSAYIANASFCLPAFWGQWRIGAIMTLLTVLVYATQMAGLVLRKELRQGPTLLPAGTAE